MWGKFICLWMVFVLLTGSTAKVHAQYFELNNNRKQVTILFRIVRNMVVIRLKINNKGPYNFIMDTGVGLMIITEPALIDTLHLTGKRFVKLSGVGNEPAFEAVLTSPLQVEVSGLTSFGVGAAAFTKDHFGLSAFTGIPTHGLLGYEFFNELAVKVNFNDSTLTVCRPENLRHLKKYVCLPLSVENNKPYLTIPVHFCDQTVRSCKLLADLGSGHALMLNDLAVRNWPLTQCIPGNLGIGLTGVIEGKIGRVAGVELGKYLLKSVLSSFPDTGLDLIAENKYDGNIGMDIFKKFTVIFDYTNQAVYLKPRYTIKEPFEHDMSGIEYYAAGSDYKHIIINRIEPGSPAEAASLQTGDELTTINFKPVAQMSLEEIDEIFCSKDGRNLILGVYNHKKAENVILTLKRRI